VAVVKDRPDSFPAGLSQVAPEDARPAPDA
jgi:hypothetical protein